MLTKIFNVREMTKQEYEEYEKFLEEFFDNNNKLFFGDSREVLKSFPSNSIDLVITSPPYKDSDNYSPELICNVFNEVYRIQKKDTLLFLNFGHLAEDKLRPFRVALMIEALGYKLAETFVWVKNHYTPIQGSRRVNNLTEFIFMFFKGNMPKLDRLSIGVPYKDKSNIGRYSNNDLKCGGNVWHINYPTIQKSDDKLHNDRFPEELPERCIKLCDYEINNILDPFMGSGTTGVVANRFGINFYGVEINKTNYTTAVTRLRYLYGDNE